MKRVYLVRHGQTASSAQHAYSGQADIPLTDLGRRQAREAGEHLRDAGVDRIYTSPLVRAADTAEAIAQATGAALEVAQGLLEVDYGPLEGLDRAGAQERFGEAFRAWRADPFGSPVDGMERLEDALVRARSATECALAASERPVLVGHQGILRLVLIALGRVERSEYFETRLTEAEPIEVTLG
ncbi:MAG: histidine phosphatase family protein [Solirubrobacteraceae bacterium]